MSQTCPWCGGKGVTGRVAAVAHPGGVRARGGDGPPLLVVTDGPCGLCGGGGLVEGGGRVRLAAGRWQRQAGKAVTS